MPQQICKHQPVTVSCLDAVPYPLMRDMQNVTAFLQYQHFGIMVQTYFYLVNLSSYRHNCYHYHISQVSDFTHSYSVLYIYNLILLLL